jgi:ElaB/YqjD/DUF883 family membrane-anchored ribosome-binding protein
MTDKHEAETAANDLSADIAQLRDDLGRLSASVADLVRSQAKGAATAVRDKVNDNLASMGDAVSERAANASASAFRFADGAQDRIHAAGDNIQGSIEKNPLAAALIAAGLGLAIGLMTARS